MNLLPKINFLLTILLSVGLVALFIQSTSLRNAQALTNSKIEAMDVKATSPSEIILPEAGESGKIDINSLKAYVDAKVAQVTTVTNSTTVPSGSSKPVATAAPKKITSFVPIFSENFVTTSTDWVDVEGSDFTFNISDFGSGSYATWDSYMFIQGGSGEAHARLFDVTHSVSVQGSEIIGTSAKVTAVTSGKLVFFSGNNTYRVQMKSLTSSPVQFDNGRIKIVY